MKHNRVVHTYTEHKVELFWWIVYLLTMLAGFLTGLALIVTPIALYMEFQLTWLLILFIFIPIGLWMDYKMFHVTKKLFWKNQHLSSYILFEDKIELKEWPELYSTSPIERKIPFQSISSVIASYYIVRESIVLHTGTKITENAPMLYILYTLDGERKLLNIPFPNHQDEGFNVWLGHLHEEKLPLHYTARPLYRTDTQILNDQQRLDYFETTNELIVLPFSGSWKEDEPKAFANWKEEESERQAIEESLNPKLKEARLKHSRRDWSIIPNIVFTFMGIAIFFTLEMAKKQWLPADNVIFGLIIFTLGGFLFFYYLKRYLPWYYMIYYLLIVLVLGLISLSSGPMHENLLQQQMAKSIAISSFLFPAFVWIPYFTIKKTAKKQ